MNRTLIGSLIILLIPSLGCTPRSYYAVTVNRAEEISPVRKQLGDEGQSAWLMDGDIKIGWSFVDDQFKFNLLNDSDSPLRVLWDDMAIVTPDQKTHRVFTNGVTFIGRDAPIKPSVVPAKASLEAIVAASDLAHFNPGPYGGWVLDPVISEEELGQPVKILMPLELGGKRRDYEVTLVVEKHYFQAVKGKA